MTLNKPVFFERRSTLRYRINLPVELVLEDGTVLPVDATDISNKGLQFRCDGWAAEEIEPRGIQSLPLDQISLKIVADLPGMGEPDSRLYARCRLIVVRRVSQNEYILGVEFIDFENGSDRLLEQFIRQCEGKYQRKETSYR